MILHSGHQEEKQASISITEKVFSNIIIVHRAHQERKYHQKSILKILHRGHRQAKRASISIRASSNPPSVLPWRPSGKVIFRGGNTLLDRSTAGIAENIDILMSLHFSINANKSTNFYKFANNYNNHCSACSHSFLKRRNKT